MCGDNLRRDCGGGGSEMMNLLTGLLIGLLAAPQLPHNWVNVVERDANGVGELFLNIVTVGGKVWDQIGATQASTILDKVDKEARDVQNEKMQLRQDLADGNDANLQRRIDDLKQSIRTMQADLGKFAQEIDKAAPPPPGGADPLKEINQAEIYKIAELDDVFNQWSSGAHARALESLDDALQKLQTMQNGIGCLETSIKIKKTACDKNLKLLITPQ
jgi:hypothetical protein